MQFLNVPIAIAAAAILLLPCEAKLGHGPSPLDILQKRHSHNRLHASPRAEDSKNLLQKRGTCAFPTDAGLVAVTPDSTNAGWAMSPDQACTPGSYCPYACPPGQVMAQWNPKATSYTYPLSMDGGLYCDSNGKISKPFSNQPYCVSGTGTVGVVNSCGGSVSFCQTVLPGNEAMLIPTSVDGSSQLAVPGTSYWCETAAHYYINAPGVSTADACIWGDGSKPIGNWAPYVAGANTVANGDTYLKIGWNPIWTSSSLSDTMPTFGIKIECSGSGCNGLPCSIDPSVVGIGGVTSADQASGAGGANFCVVTVPSGLTADVVCFANSFTNPNPNSQLIIFYSNYFVNSTSVN
ncbi:putative sun domain protein [Botrytis cinerea BcDW1]|uniref:Putative sun domain protein n=1 Tax=Botryotinia fuckeliana (strain BcDW1) TaxID=1290391 RepID=M7U789_BOTF1|nr:putative sun domain protein [Botrytis cinerea BcDW1]